MGLRALRSEPIARLPHHPTPSALRPQSLAVDEPCGIASRRALLGDPPEKPNPEQRRPMSTIELAGIDYTILVLYFIFVVGIGVALKRYQKSSTDFFLSGRSIPAWVAGLAFLSANLGSQEVIGMAASGAKYGISTSHFYWIGAVPAMVFLGVFMMPFYYGSRARSVPEYLKLRFDE